MSAKHSLALTAIRIDGGTQPRVVIDETAVADYAEKMRMGVNFPPVVVFFDGADHWLADGFHRFHAAKKADWHDIGAEIHQGTRREAVLYSVAANDEHGIRRTNADKRKAVTTLLEDDEWKQWVNAEIARRCGVSHTLVNDMRPVRSLEAASSENSRTYKTKHGTRAAMQVQNIGKGDRSADAVKVRRELLRSMATEGYSVPQIAERIGVDERTVGKIAKDIGVDLSQARTSSNVGRHDSNRIVEHIVMDAENLTADTGLVTFSALDRARLPAWIDSLIQSRRSLDALIKVLKEEANGEAA